MFIDRAQAGQALVKKLIQELIDHPPLETVVLAIPRGGVVVGNQIAKALQQPLDIIVSKKIVAPNQKELAIGAVGQTQGSLYFNNKIIDDLKISKDYLDQEIELKQAEISRREILYRAGKSEITLNGKRVILVDDGAATGATMISAAREVWNRQPEQVIIAIPVCSKQTLAILETEVDIVIVLETPDDFYAVGQFYQSFEQVEDEQVIKILKN
ncbi:phosphoribosyltransferase [Candidatus Beckwithbacteria bacterium CG23_combo_of_CG06-09_8_20_14_all_34_8]|uniref:Phosphoribosyltransferase n=1 Tax=Candidatus Beckwithbacteria bacterium CG23_combo_of_CG06-09_8_20_14_all_34_8 TaxID=1974497 RepID=A0A2H0B6Q0_9BACT|nr:MAG: phosphoribosyltransferase [Candidatus Beckwithbacteria bacterium CG23_combo_of_CG06-09_8_20_14_all_34_8]